MPFGGDSSNQLRMVGYYRPEDEKGAMDAALRQEVQENVHAVPQAPFRAGLVLRWNRNPVVPVFDVDRERVAHPTIVASGSAAGKLGSTSARVTHRGAPCTIPRARSGIAPNRTVR